MSIYSNIVALCKKNTISLNELEKALGFWEGYISEYRVLPSGRVKAIANYFNTTVAELVSEKASEPFYAYRVNSDLGTLDRTEITEYEVFGNYPASYSLAFKYNGERKHVGSLVFDAYSRGFLFTFNPDPEYAKDIIKKALLEKAKDYQKKADDLERLVSLIL